MLSLDFICQHPQVAREALLRRRESDNIDEILHLAEQWRGLVARKDGLYASLRELRSGLHTHTLESRPGLNQQMKATIRDIRQLEIQVADTDTRLRPLLLSLPNFPHQSVPDGGPSQENHEIRKWGNPLSFHFEPKAHWDIGERLGLFDAEGGTKIAGSRFVLLKGTGARLERALISFLLDLYTLQHGYTEIMPPLLVKRSLMLGAAQFPKFEDQAYTCAEDELYLNTAPEVPLLGIHSDSVLPADILPLRYVAWTTAFRRNVGVVSQQTRGLLRLHQFNTLGILQLTAPKSSYETLEQMVLHAETALRHLELSYRVVELSVGNLPFASAKTIDVEVWMAGQQRYLGIASVSNCETFQARRANIKYRSASSARAEYVHTLNAAGLAVGQVMAAILETYQQADGSVIIPKVLRPYMTSALLSPLYE